MKRKNIIASIFAVGIVLFSSCDESLLDINQKATTSPETYYTEDVINEAIANCYSQWARMGITGSSLKRSLSDDAYSGGNQRNDNTGVESLFEKTYTSSSYSGFSNYMGGLYKLIYNANCVIEYFKDYTSNPEVRRAIAEAHFFRAYAYLDLVSLWGTPPYVDHILAQSEFRTPNGDRKALWELIVSDLEYAINSGDLMEKVLGNRSTTIRVTKQAAQAYLGKALLYQATYDNPSYGNLNNGKHGWDTYSVDYDALLGKAVANLNAVVDGGQYKLINDFSALGHTEADYCDEYILQNNAPNALIGNNPDWVLTGFNTFAVMWSWRWQGGILSAAGNTEIGSNYYTTGGYGFQQGVTKQYTIDGDLSAPGLVDAFESSPGEANSQRRLWTYRTWDEISAMGVQPGGTAYGTSGYFNMKVLYRKAGGTRGYMGDMDLSGTWTYFAGSYANLAHMRYAEVLLMCAEANLLYSGGSATKARDCINEIRTRAGATTYTSVDLNKVKLEYQLELACEGHRFQNLVRWGDAAQVMAKQGLYIPSLVDGASVTWYKNSASNPGFKPDKNELLPIYTNEFIVNPNIRQNPGY